MGRLDDKVALITGAGAGIGKRAACIFAREGAKVVVAELTPDVGRETVRLVEQSNGTAMFVQTDVTDPESVRAMVARGVEQFGRLDIIYNNAGGSTPRDSSVVDSPIEEFWHAIKLNLLGTWLTCKYGIPELIKAGGGSVINAASMVALVGYPGKDAYTPSKGAIVALTRSLAVEFASKKIRVNAIAPGVVRTERVAPRVDAGLLPRAIVDRHLLGLVEPDDVANAALFFASHESRLVTGQILSVDSGVTIS